MKHFKLILCLIILLTVALSSFEGHKCRINIEVQDLDSLAVEGVNVALFQAERKVIEGKTNPRGGLAYFNVPTGPNWLKLSRFGYYDIDSMYVYIKEEGSSHFTIRMDQDPDSVQPQRDPQRGRLVMRLRSFDANMHPIAGASYEIQQADSLFARGYTSERGLALEYLPPGKYTLVLGKKGFKRTRIWDIPISKHMTTHLPLTMYLEMTWDKESDSQYSPPDMGGRSD